MTAAPHYLPPGSPGPAPVRRGPLPWIALGLGIASPLASLVAVGSGFAQAAMAAPVTGPPVSSLFSSVAGLLALAAIVVGIVGLVQRRRPLAPSIIGMALPIVGQGAAVLLAGLAIALTAR